MTKKFVLSLTEKAVRFTPSDEMAVLDAIRVLSGSDTAEDVWKKLKDENPQILSHCKQVFFSKTKSATDRCLSAGMHLSEETRSSLNNTSRQAGSRC